MRACAMTLAALLHTFITEPGQAASTAIDAELQTKLVEMGKQDQQIREKITPFVSSGNVQSDDFKRIAQEMAVVDAANLAELKKIIELNGWPGRDLVGDEASNAAFLILQHAPLPDKKGLLPLFRQAVASGRARTADLALLEDRILIGEGKKQLYGSQVTAGPDGIPRVDPIEDPENLDSRRKAIGLPPIDEYLRQLESEIGRTIDRQALKAR